MGNETIISIHSSHGLELNYVRKYFQHQSRLDTISLYLQHCFAKQELKREKFNMRHILILGFSRITNKSFAILVKCLV